MATNAQGLLRPWLLSGFAIALLAASPPSSAACLLRPQSADGIATVYTLMVAPEGEVAEYIAMGFRRAQCPKDMTLIRAYVERLCGSGRDGIPPLNTDALFGRPRKLLCASAQAGLKESGG